METASALKDGRVDILVVDDRPENLLSIDAILDRADYRLFKAQSGKAALDLAEREHFALILLDAVMPIMDGFEVARRLKLIEHARNVPIVFLTAVATDLEQIYRAYSVGAVDYLIKPLDPEIVRRKVAVLVELYCKTLEIERQAALLRVAERREFEIRLAELRLATDARYRKLVDGIGNVITWSASADSFGLSFVSRQAEAILGTGTSEQLQADFWEKHIHPGDKNRVLAAFDATVSERRDHTLDHRMLRADGEMLWFHTSVSIEDDNGVPQLHGISVDVTALKRAEQEALEATAVKDELLAVVSHDLRNPLASIVTSAEAIKKLSLVRANPERAERSIDVIARSAERMEHLIANLLDLSRIQAGRLEIHREEIDVAGLINESVEMFAPVAEQRRIELEVSATETMPLMCDRERILQVLSNLMGNAIKVTPAGGTIRISCTRNRDELEVTVADTGPGIAEDEVAHVFERYWQARGNQRAGMGLGLTIAKALVEAHGGRIWAEKANGRGAIFHFTIPATRPGSRPDMMLVTNSSSL